MRSWITLVALFIATGLGLFLYKVVILDYPLVNPETAATWRAELVVSLSSEGKRVVADVLLPRTSGYQRLLSEEMRSDPLRFSISETAGMRAGRWSGKLTGSTSVSYHVTFDALAYGWKLPPREARQAGDYPKSVQPFLQSSAGIPVSDPTIAELSSELRLDATDKVALAAEIYDFVSREIGTLNSAGAMDAVTVVREGRGNELGRARLFCSLARFNGLPCQVVPGVRLVSGTQNTLHFWNEAYLGAGWVPFDCIERLMESFPPDRLALSGDLPVPVSAAGTTSVSYRYDVESELAAYVDLMRKRLAESANVIDQWSLLLLPLHMQNTLRVLLLVPLGALAMSILRSVIGLRTFGMFMPMLIALAMTATGLMWGTAFLAGIVFFALVSRIWIKRLYLLLVARVAFVLTLVVILMTVLMYVGDRFTLPTEGVGAFPFVIMTMIVERISVSLEEEGWRNTLTRVGTTVLSIYITFAVIQAKFLQTFLLVFPESLLVILGLQVAIGKYTGYRLVELFRFRELANGNGAGR
jgi:hypothetical protein